MTDEEKKQEDDADLEKKDEILQIREKKKSLEKDIVEDLKIDTSEIIEECRNAPNKTQKYIEVLNYYRRRCVSKKILMDRLFAEYFGYYKSFIDKKGHKFGDKFPRDFNSGDAKIMVDREKEVILAKTIYEETKVMVIYLEEVVENFKSRSYQLKNIVEVMKMERVS